jgi:hypothetical protein
LLASKTDTLIDQCANAPQEQAPKRGRLICLLRHKKRYLIFRL